MTSPLSITSTLVVAFCLCKRKAFLLSRGDTGEPPHEYIQLLDARAAANRSTYLDSLAAAGLQVQRGYMEGITTSADVLANVLLRFADLEANVDVLVRGPSDSAKAHRHYEPHLVLGTNTITKEDRLRLAFVSYVLSEAYHYHPAVGTIINFAGHGRQIQLSKAKTDVLPNIETIRGWKNNQSAKPPPIILNDHCPLCPFRAACLTQAEQEDNLSLLDRMTPKIMQKYQKKGIFTVNQLSYLFKPRRQRRKRQLKPLVFKLELQALALRTRKVYVDQPPSIPEHPTELFLDIEGVPDQGIHYLIGCVHRCGEAAVPNSIEPPFRLCNHLLGYDRCRFISASNPLFVHGLPVICSALLVISEHLFGDAHIEFTKADHCGAGNLRLWGQVRSFPPVSICEVLLSDTQRASEWLYGLATTFRHSN